MIAALKEERLRFALCDPQHRSCRSEDRAGAEAQAVLATLYALAGMLVYIAFRFEWVSGVAAVIAVFHDTLITVGLLSIFNFEIVVDGCGGSADAGRLLDE